MATQSSPAPQPVGGLYTSPKRLYLTADGEVVENGDPRAESLLVAAGATLPWKKAQQYGLVPAAEGAAPPPQTPPASAEAEATPAEEPNGKAQSGPQATKQQAAPGGTK